VGRRKHPRGKAHRRTLPSTGPALTVADLDEPPSRGWRIFVWFVIPALICGISIPVGADIIPSWSAKLGHGVPGTFTAQYCQRGKADCDWVGYFASNDGTDQRSNVHVDGDSAITAAGQQIPAVDTGDWTNVYPVGGGTEWGASTAFALVLLLVLGFWIAKVPVATLRRRTRRRSAARIPA
jgi:hypothetical protein